MFIWKSSRRGTAQPASRSNNFVRYSLQPPRRGRNCDLAYAQRWQRRERRSGSLFERSRYLLPRLRFKPGPIWVFALMSRN